MMIVCRLKAKIIRTVLYCLVYCTLVSSFLIGELRSIGLSLGCCMFTFMQLRGQIHARTWCCEVVGGCEVVGDCEVRFCTSSQIGPRKWMLRWSTM